MLLVPPSLRSISLGTVTSERARVDPTGLTYAIKANVAKGRRRFSTLDSRNSCPSEDVLDRQVPCVHLTKNEPNYG